MNTITNLEEIEKFFSDNFGEKYLIHSIMYEYADLYTTSIDLLKEEISNLYKNNNRLEKMIRKKMNELMINTSTHSIRRTICRCRYCFIKVNNLVKNNRFIKEKADLKKENHSKIKEKGEEIKKLNNKRTKTFDLLGKKI